MDTEVRIVFTAGTHWVSRVIRWALRSSVSHVYLEYPSHMWGGRWAVEATKGGVRKVQAKKARHHVKAEFICKFSPREGMAAAAGFVGAKYDYTGAVVLGIVALLWRWLRVKVRHPLTNSGSQFCSEFVSRILKESDLPGTEKWEVELSGPGRLHRYCSAHPELFSEVQQ